MGLTTAAPDRLPHKLSRCRDKDNITTTGSLGARICGMRVYKVDNGKFQLMDKHRGKELNPQGFCEALQSFFDNGRLVYFASRE
mmetsp:Transcript_72140/g.192835  ORF Transcript_72140/g.192835 Transcript_72140/m.192835 type:complete len:84 (-) Transcript_72140:1261-1512(-)